MFAVMQAFSAVDAKNIVQLKNVLGVSFKKTGSKIGYLSGFFRL